jgi:hypothetical protein
METHAKCREGPNSIPARILYERARDDLERVCDSAERARLDARYRPSARVQAYRDGHLDRSATRNERRVEHDVSRDGHRIGKVTVDLVQDVFGWSAKEDGTRFWGCAFGQEGEVSGRRR